MCAFKISVAASAVLMAFLCVAEAGADESDCPHVRPMKNLDFDKVSRQWFIVSESKSTLDNDASTEKCMKLTYRGYRNGSISITYTAEATEDGTRFHIFYYGAPVDGVNSKLSYVTAKDPEAGYVDTIFATNYRDYLLVVTCEKHPATYVVQVYSTKKSLDDGVKDEVRQKLLDADLDPEDLKDVDQDNC